MTHPVRDEFAPKDAVPSPASDPDRDPPAPDAGTVPLLLFVCRRNSCRSQFAEAFARAAGLGRIRVASAGLEPAVRVDPLAAHVMRERGIEISRESTKRLSALRAQSPDLVVWIRSREEVDERDLLPPGVIEWEVEDPIGWPLEVYRDVRDEIQSLVQHVLQEMPVQSTALRRMSRRRLGSPPQAICGPTVPPPRIPPAPVLEAPVQPA